MKEGGEREYKERGGMFAWEYVCVEGGMGRKGIKECVYVT